MKIEKRIKCEGCIIKQMNSFKALSKEELKSISDKKETRIIKKGEVIFKEGERLKGVFCVRDGISKLSKMSGNGRDQIIKLANKGEVLGQRSVITSERANLSATALEDMSVCFVPKAEIEKCVAENPSFTKALLNNMANELKLADVAIVNMAHKTVRQRLAEVLLYLDESFGTDQDGYLYLQLSRTDIANLVGTATELLIRTLAVFKKENSIVIDGKRIKLIDKKVLYNIVEGL